MESDRAGCWWVLLIGLLAVGPVHTTRAAAGPVLLVAGYESDNVVRFDLTTGQWSEMVRLPPNSLPRGITAGPAGDVFLSLQGGDQNISRLVPRNGELRLQSVSPAFGQFGPGFILHGGTKIWAAGDTERVVYEVDPGNGDVTAPPQYRNCCNMVGLAVDGDTLYAAEYFQASVLRFRVGSGDRNWERFIAKSEHLNRPVGMTIGHNGNLYVANGLVPTVVEFDIRTGDYVRTLIDVGAGGKEGIHGVVYSPQVRRYYLASGSNVYEVDVAGRLLATYNSPALKKAYGIALTASTPVPADGPGVSAPGGLVRETPAGRPVTTLRATRGNLHVSGAVGERYRVMATVDFQTWEPIAELNNAAGLVDFVDPEASRFSMRFYRLELLQGDAAVR